MSRQASMDQLSEDESASGSARVRRRRGGYRMESQDSTASRDSMSRYAEGQKQCNMGGKKSAHHEMLEGLEGISVSNFMTSTHSREPFSWGYS